MHNLKKLLAEIKPAFPILDSTRIIPVARKLKSDLMRCRPTTRSGFHYQITVDFSLSRASEQAIIGGLSHELVHIKIFRIFYKPRSISWDDYCSISKEEEERDERLADILAIKGGFARQVLEFRKYQECHVREGDKCYSTGLTVREVRQRIKQAS